MSIIFRIFVFKLINTIEMEKVRTCRICNIKKLLNKENFEYKKCSKPNKKVKWYYARMCQICRKKQRWDSIYNERYLARITYRRTPERDMARRAGQRAMKAGFAFSITKDDIIIPKYCPILGLKLKISTGRANDSSPSLDRINNELGYIPGNIQVISNLANVMKAHATKKQLEMFAKNILTYINND